MRPLPTSIRNALGSQGQDLTVLVIRLAAMGDILRTLPPVRLVKRALPRSRILWAVDDRWRPVLEGHPDLDGLVVFPRKEWQRLSRSPASWPKLLSSVRGLRSRLREVGADVVLDFHGNLRSGVVSRMTAAPVRIGYEGHQQKEINRFFNTHHCPSGSRRAPRMQRNLDLVRALGLPDHPLPGGALPLVARGKQAADGIVREYFEGGPFAVISPGASAAQAMKKPPPSLLSSASRLLVRRGIGVLVVWGPGEEADAAAVTGDLESGATLAPPTDLPTLAALLARARLFVGGDSGPMHMACAVGCPVVAIYGPTDPEVNGPWGVPRRSVFPEGRAYSGIKRLDRQAGGFEGILGRHAESAVDELLGETA